MRTAKSPQRISKIFKPGLTREMLKKDTRRERQERRLKVEGFAPKTGVFVEKNVSEHPPRSRGRGTI